jgi:CDP-4-dehydro-6-deoxyglucose reductase, E3
VPPRRAPAACDLVLDGRPRALSSPPPAALNDPRQPAVRRAGTVTAVTALSPGVIEVVLTLTRRLEHRPGQSVRVALGRLPARDFVPTLRVDGTCELNEIVLHLDRAGRTAAALADGSVGAGDLARVQGPFGEAHYRPGPGRLVVAVHGTGFAQGWAIARAARCIEPERPLAFVFGARNAVDLYGVTALDWLAGTGAQRVVACAESGGARGAAGRVLAGGLAAHLPPLSADDVVHVAGPPGPVAAVAAAARTAGARCHALAYGDAPAALSLIG